MSENGYYGTSTTVYFAPLEINNMEASKTHYIYVR